MLDQTLITMIEEAVENFNKEALKRVDEVDILKVETLQFEYHDRVFRTKESDEIVIKNIQKALDCRELLKREAKQMIDDIMKKRSQKKQRR